MCNIKTIVLPFVVAAQISAVTGKCAANGLGESNPWQFQTVNDRLNKAVIDDMMRNQPIYNSQYDIVYEIDGDYINCSVSSSVTGTSEYITQDAPIGSPSIAVDGAITSDTIGNQSDSAYSWDASDSANTSNSGGGGNDSLLASGGNPAFDESRWLIDQTANGSILSSGVDGSSVDTSIGSTTGNGGNGSVALNSSSSIDHSNLSSSVSDSSACAFNRLTGEGR